MIEIWKPIKNYEGKYEISNFGRVKSLQRWSKTKFYNREKMLTPYINKRNGYAYIYLTKDNKGKNVRIHRLVAEHFIDNPNNYQDINHKDCNRANNRVDNLEWCTRSYNVKYSFTNGKAKSNFRKKVK